MKQAKAVFLRLPRLTPTTVGQGLCLDGSAQRALGICGLMGMILIAGCTKGTAPERVPDAPAAPATANAAPAAPVAVAATQLETFPAVDTSRLDPSALTFFKKVANEEVCPCDCPKSFGQCLQAGTQCAPAVLLANWLIGELEQGVPGEMLEEAITKELTSGFQAPQKTLVTDGYASKGAANPKYTIVEFADFECAHCKAASAVVDELVKQRNDVKVVYKHFPLSFHPMAKKGAIVAEAAAKQGKFWEMHGAIFATQDMLSDDLLLGHAKAIGLDIEKFKKDASDPAVQQHVEKSQAEGAALGIAATPAFFVNGRPYYLSRSLEGFALRFAMEDARATSSCQ